MIIITVVSGPDKGGVFRLPDDQPVRIGRRHGSVPLNDKGASSRHAEISFDHAGWVVRDLGSSNGTYVNGERIHDVVTVHDGDRIQVGRSMVVFTHVPDGEQAHGHDGGASHGHGHADADAAMHAALDAQRRNHELLSEVRALLEERRDGGDAPLSGEVASLMRQIVDRLDDLTARPIAAAPAPPPPDPRLDDVLDQVRALRQRESIVVPAAEPVDLEPVLDAIASLRHAAKPAPAEKIDLAPVLDAIAAVGARITPAAPADLSPITAAIAALEAAMPAAPQPVDFKPVLDAVAALNQKLAPPVPVDLSPVTGAIAALGEKITPATPVDLSPITAAIAALKADLSTATKGVDFTPVLDAVAALNQKLAPPVPVDLSPVTGAIAALGEKITPATPVDLSPITAAIAALKADLSTATKGVDFKPVLDAVAALNQKLAPPAPVDLSPVTGAIAALKAAMPAAPERVDLGPVLEAIGRADRSPQLAERIDAVLGEVKSLRESAMKRADASASALPEALSEPLSALRERIDAIAADAKAAAERKTDAAPLLDALGALAGRIDAIKPADAGAQIERLDRIAASIAELRTHDHRADTDAAIAELRLQLGEIASKLDTPQSAMHEKLDQLLDAATSPPSPAGSPGSPGPAADQLADVVVKITELRTGIESLAARIADTPAGADTGASPDGDAGDIAARVFDRIDALEGALAERLESDRLADLAVLDEKIDAIVDVLRGMAAEREQTDADADAAMPRPALEELDAKLSVIYEAIEASRGESRTVTVAGGELDSLIDMVRSQSESTDAVAALQKVYAKLEGMQPPTPVLDPDLLQRLENVSLKLEKFQLMAVDFPDPRGLIEQKLEPLLRQVHERITAAEPVDLTGTERGLAELSESIRDAMNRSDRPLLEQILLELRQRTAAAAPGEAIDADKIELILERLGRMQSAAELGPLVERVQQAVDASGNDKIVALLRQLIEYVQKMPSRFDGKEVMDNVFQSLRRLEQQQESQSASIRRLIAAVGHAEASMGAAAPQPAAAIARPSVASRAVSHTRPARPAPPAPPATPADDSAVSSFADDMMAGLDPATPSRGRARLLTLVLILALPLALFAVVHFVQQAGRVQDTIERLEAPAPASQQPANPADAAPLQARR